ncbi:serine hydrolase [Sphingomicrobium sediminis]|uniref:Serine hydrolase n=1 Tax=Sphingomicrobium sediminis TaxID=2950949 RepID=A0A9X2J0H0_9SPHN|nr:serine hydrolase [Sphingomicrobium sediminis]MCM8556268.1 serine hydrolase [Sphingomicrobium sediminis]
MISTILAASLALTPQPGIDDRLKSLAQSYGVDGFAATLVPAEGEPMLVTYGTDQEGKPFTADTVCGLFSASKALSSIAFIKLHEAGVIDLDATLSSYDANLPQAWHDIPFYTLLNHSSGLPMVVNREEFAALSEDSEARNADVVDLIRDAPLDYPTGSASRYRQSGYALAEMLITAKLGEDWNSIMERLVYDPADLTVTGHNWGANESFLIQSAGGTRTSARDMARLLTALRDGALGDLSEWDAMAHDPEHVIDGYSIGLILEGEGEARSIGHQGGGRSNFRYAPAVGAGAMICTDDRTNNAFHQDLGPVMMDYLLAGNLPEPTLKVALLDALSNAGLEDVDRALRSALESDLYDADQAKRLLNQLGYGLLREGRIDAAILLFARNIERNPDDAGLWDSVGDGLRAQGDSDGALQAYGKAVMLDPSLKETRAKIEELEAS